MGAKPHHAIPGWQADKQQAGHGKRKADVDGTSLYLDPHACTPGCLLFNTLDDPGDVVFLFVDEQGREGRGDLVPEADISELVDTRNRQVHVKEFVHQLQDPVVLAEDLAECIQFSLIGVATGHRLQGFIHVDEAGGHADGPGPETVTQQVLHLPDLIVGRYPVHGFQAHDPEAQGAVPDQWGNIDRQVFPDSLDKLVEGFPVPFDAFLEGLEGHFLDLVEHADQLHAVLGLERRQ